MTTLDARARARLLFVERWLEQVRSTLVPRRARSLSAHAALEETLGLAASFVRSGGTTRPAIDPEDGGHGVHMLRDVADETADLLGWDEVLRARYPDRKQVLFEVVTSFGAKENVTQEAVEVLRSLAIPLRRTAIQDGFSLLLEVVEKSPEETKALCSLAETLVSELRCRGWSDEAIETAGKDALNALEREGVRPLETLRDRFTAETRLFACFVGVDLPPSHPAPPAEDPTIALVAELPDLPIRGRPVSKGAFFRVMVTAPDPHAAASLAWRRVVSTIGALTVFLPACGVRGDLVAVDAEDGNLTTIDMREKMPLERRASQPSEQARILRSAWQASGSATADPLHDALRLRDRALAAHDSESRLLLLWSSIERMTAGARGHDGALSAAKDLVSHAVTLGKLRRDVGDLIASILWALEGDVPGRAALLDLVGVERTGPSGPFVEPSRERVLAHLLGDDAMRKKLTALFYARSPLLALRCHQLWEDLGAGKTAERGKLIAAYLERSRERVARQVGRIYRARNRIAHVGASPERVRDLAWHAHFYLTQIIAICIHHTEARPRRAQEVLGVRVGQYRAFVRLLQRGDATIMTPEILLRPTLAVG